METILVNVKDKSDRDLLLALAKKLGLSARTLTKEENEDWALAKEIEKGMKTEDVSREEVMKALNK